jgi:hypothetical protein
VERRVESQHDELQELKQRIMGLEWALREQLPEIRDKLPPMPFEDRERVARRRKEIKEVEGPSLYDAVRASLASIIPPVQRAGEYVTGVVNQVVGVRDEAASPPGSSEAGGGVDGGAESAVRIQDESGEAFTVGGRGCEGQGLLEGGNAVQTTDSEGVDHIKGTSLSGEAAEKEKADSDVHRPSLYSRMVAGVAALSGGVLKIVMPRQRPKSEE